MTLTVIGPAAAPFPYEYPDFTVERKQLWGDEWIRDVNMEVQQLSELSGNSGSGSCQLTYRYGAILRQWNDDYATETSLNLQNWWVRVSLASEQGVMQQWIGRITTESRNVLGSDDALSGVQSWIAYAPLTYLRKKYIDTSYWYERNETTGIREERILGWIPSMNVRDDRGQITGNRSTVPSGNVYLYGGSWTDGTSNWTRYQYLEYILEKYANETDGPKWTLSGQTDLLKDMTDFIDFGATQNIASILTMLISHGAGMDFAIEPTDDGFTIRVFSLLPEEYTYGDVTLEANPDELRAQVGTTKDLISTTVVRTNNLKFSKIRVVGERAVICTTIKGADYWIDSNNTDLIPKWDADLQTEYEAGNGGGYLGDKVKHDTARQKLKYRDVFQRYGAPESWGYAMPVMSKDGTLPALTDVTNAPFQKFIRSTLPWIPLRSGFDYSTDPATDYNGANVEPEFLTPLVWLLVKNDPVQVTKPYKRAERLGYNIYAPENDWGVFIESDPNHLLALGHTDIEVSPSPGTVGGTYHSPIDDYDSLVATIAYESDHRLAIEYNIPDADDESVLVIYEPATHLWLLAPYTNVGTWQKTGSLDQNTNLTQSGPKWRELRNDASRLYPIMAGAIARFYRERARAELTIQGYRPWGGFIGKIFSAVEEDGETQEIKAPITSVSWSGGRTIIRTGFAE